MDRPRKDPAGAGCAWTGAETQPGMDRTGPDPAAAGPAWLPWPTVQEVPAHSSIFFPFDLTTVVTGQHKGVWLARQPCRGRGRANSRSAEHTGTLAWPLPRAWV